MKLCVYQKVYYAQVGIRTRVALVALSVAITVITVFLHLVRPKFVLDKL